MLAKLLGLVLAVTVCVHLAKDVVAPLHALDHHAPVAFEAGAGGSATCEAAEPCCADPSGPCASQPLAARLAKGRAAARLHLPDPELLAQHLFRPPLSPRLS